MSHLFCDSHSKKKGFSWLVFGAFALAFVLTSAHRECAAQPAFDPGSTAADTIINISTPGFDLVTIQDVPPNNDGIMQIVTTFGNLNFPSPTNSLTINFSPFAQTFFVYASFDTLFNPASGVILNGGPLADFLNASQGITPHIINGGDGGDSLDGSPFVDTINGGPGVDTIAGREGDDIISAGPNNDTIVVGVPTGAREDGNDTIDGGGEDAADLLRIFGNSTLGDDLKTSGGMGSGRIQIIRTNLVPFTINAEGIETLEIETRGANDTITVCDMTGVADLTTLDIDGGGNNDTIDASALPSGVIATVILNGSSGNDMIFGSQGPDQIIGFSGNDEIQGNAGNDCIDAGSGSQDVVRWNDGDGSDTVDGGGDFLDRMIINAASAGDIIVVDTTCTGAPACPTILPAFSCEIHVERTNLTPFDLNLEGFNFLVINGLGGIDNIDASALPAGLLTQLEINGDGSHDVIVGSQGDDLIAGGNGNDDITPGPGNDDADGNGGFDTFTWNDGDGSDTFDGGGSGDTLEVNGSSMGDDIVTSPGMGGRFFLTRTNLVPFQLDVGEIENVHINGLDGDDTMDCSPLAAGTITNLILNGNNGEDTLTGTQGRDFINGGANDDTIDGQAGADSIQGDGGNDDLMGGDDGDNFFWGDGDGSDTVDGEGGDDQQSVSTSDSAENLLISPNGIRCFVARTNLTPFTLDIGTVETIGLNTSAGNDTVDVQNLSGVTDLSLLDIDLGNDNDIANIEPSPNVMVNVDGGTGLGIGMLRNVALNAVIENDIFNYLGLIPEPPTAPNGTYSQAGFQNVIASNFELGGALGGDPPVDGIVRVDPIGGNDLNDGSSFMSDGMGVGPKQTLQAAVDCLDGVGGGQVWARQGLYKPMTSQVALDSGGTTVATKIALVLKPNVKVYGGFAGTETTLDERDRDPKLTVIDGSMADNGSAGCHVVAIVDVTSTCLSGVMIQGGSGEDTPPIALNGSGGGIFVSDADDTNQIENCVIACNIINSIGGSGAGIFIRNSSIGIHQSIVSNNHAFPLSRGGGIALIDSSVVITKSYVCGNTANAGGGIAILNFSGPLLMMENCVVSGNEALPGFSRSSADLAGQDPSRMGFLDAQGGGILLSGGDLKAINCTVADNVANTGGGVSMEHSNNETTFKNVLFARNMNYAIVERFDTSDPTGIFNCLFRGNTPDDYSDFESGDKDGDDINFAILPTIAQNNNQGVPRFIMDTFGVTGQWDSGVYNAVDDTTTLTDDDALLTPGSLSCSHLIVDTAGSKLQALILDNTETEIIVKGDFTAEGVPDATYLVVDYDILNNSGAVDMGCDVALGFGNVLLATAPLEDILCRVRPVDVAGIGAEGGPRRNQFPAVDVTIFDIGAFEASGALFVELVSFSASSAGAGAPVVVSWETSLEVDNVGFNVYSANAEGERGKRLNAFVIPSEGGSGAYEFVDTPLAAGEERLYYLEDIDVNGVSSYHGPVSVLVGSDAGGSESAPAVGDVNGDGAVDQVDAILLYRAVTAGEDVGPQGDVNGDGAVNITDAIALYRSVIGAGE